MKVKVCFVCLKTNKNPAFIRNANGKDVDDLYFKFWRFVGGYLGIESGIDKESSWMKECFCDECKNVVGSLCQLYRQLLQVQLRLSSKLGELLKLMESSESGVSHKLERVLIKSLAEQLGFAKTSDVDELRSLLKVKCKVKSQKALPEIFIHPVKLPPPFANVAENVKVEITADDFLETDGDDDYAHASPLVEDEDIPSISSEENSNHGDGALPRRSIDAVSGARGVESEGETPEIKIEPLEVDEQDIMYDDNDPMYEIKRNEDSDSTFEPDAFPEHNRNESDSDSQSDWEPEEKSKKVKRSSTSRKSTSKSPRAHHEPPNTENQNLCVCQHCGKVLISSQRLRHHIYQVHRGRPFHCAECSKSFKTKAALKDHTSKTHSETIKSDFKVKKRLNEVTRSTTSTSSSSNVPGEGDFICPTCSKGFATQEKLAQHISKAHSKKTSNSVKTEPTICEKCGKTFANLNSKRLHVSRIHGNQDESPCPFCGKIFRSAYRLTRHINFTHSDKRYKCDECGVELKSKVLLNNHIIAFHNSEAHGCAECGKSPSYLQGHIDYVHRGILKRYSCPNCVIVYSQRNKLNRHLLKCTKERPLYVRTSKTPGAHNHFRTVVRWDDTAGPDADGKFPCPKCPKILETAPKRSAHVRHAHLNVNHTCGECGVVRKSKHHLERHIDACHRPKDQVCPHCGKTLATGYIPIHIKLVHPELAPEPRARVQCPSCPEGFYTKRQLEKHLSECAGRNNHCSEQNTAMEGNHSVTIL